MADYSKLTKKELKEQIYLYKDTIYKQNRIYNMLLSDYKTLKDKLLEYGKGIVSDCCIKTNTDIYQENQQLKQQLSDYKDICHKHHIDCPENLDRVLLGMEEENQQLKQQLHDLPKKIVGEIKDISLDYWDFNTCEECGYIADLSTLTIKDFDEILDTTLEKFGVEDESNND